MHILDLICTDKAVFKAMKCLADARALESKLYADFYKMQSKKAALLVAQENLEISSITLTAQRRGLLYWSNTQIPFCRWSSRESSQRVFSAWLDWSHGCFHSYIVHSVPLIVCLLPHLWIRSLCFLYPVHLNHHWNCTFWQTIRFIWEM